jgi:ribosomal protein L11 methyltransferase
MKDYLEFQFQPLEGVDTEIVMAYLGQLPFSSLWEDDLIKAYLAKEEFSEGISQSLNDMIGQWIKRYDVVDLPHINWNEQWESGFSPVEIDDYCRIYASFHPEKEGFQYQVLIDPKMAFGTGHHETTYMMVAMLRDIDVNDKLVLDFGTGTGILGILASMMGAQQVEANDIEEEAVENTQLNAQLNKVLNLNVKLGDLEVVPQQPYDLVLANINRRVLLASLQHLKALMTKEADLLISGVLIADKPLMEAAIDLGGLDIIRSSEKGEWMCWHLRKKAI